MDLLLALPVMAVMMLIFAVVVLVGKKRNTLLSINLLIFGLYASPLTIKGMTHPGGSEMAAMGPLIFYGLASVITAIHFTILLIVAAALPERNEENGAEEKENADGG